MTTTHDFDIAIDRFNSEINTLLPEISLSKRGTTSFTVQGILQGVTQRRQAKDVMNNLARLTPLIVATGEKGHNALAALNTLQSLLFEHALKPGGFSEGGFLGEEETLAGIVEQDAQLMAKMGLTYTQCADRLEELFVAYSEQRRLQRGRHDERIFSITPIVTVPSFSLSNLPDEMSGFTSGHLQLFINQYRGMQECPWGCQVVNWSSLDFLLLNRHTADYVLGPGMIVHLIREHHFFEGVGSPYRVDPRTLAAVLELGPSFGG